MVVSSQKVSCQDLQSEFPQLFSGSSGDLDRRISGVAAPAEGSPELAVFLSTPNAIQQGLASQASVLCVPTKLKSQVELQASSGRTFLFSPNPELAMARVIKKFFLTTPYVNRDLKGIHPSAVIMEGAEIASGVSIGPNAFIARGVSIATGCTIGACCVVEDDAVIGEGTVLHPHVYVGHSTVIGKKCEIHAQTVIGKEGFGYAHDEKFNHFRIAHLGRVVLEDDVHIGSHVSIDRGTFGETRICQGAKLDNQIQIGHNCSIGRNSVITSGFSVAGSTKIGANFLAGGRASVTGHIEICDNVQVAALSGVSKTMTTPGQYAGIPLVPLKDHIRIKAAMVHLPAMRKQLKLVLTKLGLKTELEEE